MLKAIGGECAGALSILPPDYEITPEYYYKELTDKEFQEMLHQKGNVASFTDIKDRPRLSLAGAQDKIPIFQKNNIYYLPQGAAPSTHIIKFEIDGVRHIPAYEYLLSQLAKEVGLLTVDCQFKKINDKTFLLVKRYDREIESNGEIRRVHQEDFCQALGIGYAKKYQQDGGPTFVDCYQLIQNISTSPIIDVENLIKWQIFNVLAGNSDGHAKNLSLLYERGRKVSLAPFYDLVCTGAVKNIDIKLAMAVDHEFNPKVVSIDHWRKLARSCNVKEDYVVKILHEVANSLFDNVRKVRNMFDDEYGLYPATERVELVIKKRCQKLLKA